jgi:citrate lyase subunit beta / citryl-CoA lyase
MRSKLFVPGSRPELFEKAWRSDADALSFDLEDAVAARAKAEARKNVFLALGAIPAERRKLVIVRVNPFGSDAFEADLDAVVGSALDILNLPKVEEPETIQTVAKRLDALERVRAAERRIGLLVNIETPRGLRRAVELATSSERVIGLQLGFGDLFSPLGIERSPAGQGPVRLAVRLAAGEAGMAAYDGAFVDISDLDGFRAEAEAARALGFAGKTCVHPSQIAIANAVFHPRPVEIERARRVVAKADEMAARGVGAFTVEGVMFDGPLIERAREIVRLVGGALNER